MYEHQMFPSQMRTALFMDPHHIRRLNVRPYHRLVVLVRGCKPQVLPPTPFKAGPSEFRMTPMFEGDVAPEYPVVLVMVEATELKHFANWEVEHVEAMIDYLLECEQDKKETRH